MDDLTYWVTTIAAYITLIDYIYKFVKSLLSKSKPSKKKKRKKKSSKKK